MFSPTGLTFCPPPCLSSDPVFTAISIWIASCVTPALVSPKDFPIFLVSALFSVDVSSSSFLIPSSTDRPRLVGWPLLLPSPPVLRSPAIRPQPSPSPPEWGEWGKQSFSLTTAHPDTASLLFSGRRRRTSGQRTTKDG